MKGINMRYSKTYLTRAHERGDQVGAFKGYHVYPITKKQIGYGEYWNEHYYIILDDDNKLFRNGKVFGIVSINGDVTLYREPLDYKIEIENLNLKSEIEFSNENLELKNEIENGAAIADQIFKQSLNTDWIGELFK